MTQPLDAVAEAISKQIPSMGWNEANRSVIVERAAAAAVEAMQLTEERLDYIGGGSVARLVGPYRYVRKMQP